MYYLFTISVYWLASWLFYRMFLEHERYFRLNRAYLLFTFLLAPVLPLLPWGSLFPNQSWGELPVVLLQTITVQAEGAPATLAASGFHWTTAVKIVWLAGSTFVLYRFLLNLRQLVSLVRKGRQARHSDHIRIEHPDITVPYSWFHFLFWNGQQDLTASEEQAIIAHELAHIKQGHSWDLLLMELSRIIFWWNPLWYAYRHSLEVVHEYLADTQALESIPKSAYGHLLLRQHLLPQPRILIHTFHTSQLKKRITMMTKSPSSLLALGKYLLFFPMLALVLLACEDAEAQQEIVQKAKQDIQEPSYYDVVDTVVTFHPSTMEEEVQLVKSRIYEVVDKMPVFGDCPNATGQELAECSYRNLLTHVYQNLQYPKAAADANQEGRALVSFVVNKTGEVTSVETIEGKTTEHALLNEAALAAVGNLPKFSPGEQDGQPVNVKMVLPIQFKLK